MSPNNLFGDAVASLFGPRIRISEAPAVVPAKPGLYAIYAPPPTWLRLGVSSTVEDGPLYVGKSEDNLLGREVFTHFNASPSRKPATGSSTVRRSFAALLRVDLQLHAQARNPLKPAGFASYGLAQDGDQILTDWMAQNLQLAFWVKPEDEDFGLKDLERHIIRHWDPPVNIDQAPTSRIVLKALRAFLANEARTNAATPVHTGLRSATADNGHRQL